MNFYYLFKHKVHEKNAAKQTLDQLHEQRRQVVMLHKRGIKIMNVVEMKGLTYPAVFSAVTQIIFCLSRLRRESRGGHARGHRRAAQFNPHPARC